MKWLLIPGADATAARKVVRRVDEILGYPRTHSEDDVVRRGRGPHAPISTIYTETATVVFLHDTTGDARLHNVIAIGFPQPTIDALRERFVGVDGIRKRLREWISDRGWGVRDTLPGHMATPEEDYGWHRRPPRDGQEGSTTGEPIPEGA